MSSKSNLTLAGIAASAAALAISLHRLWRVRASRAATIHAKQGLACQSDQVSVVTFNVLAACLVSTKKYSYVPPGQLAWDYRWRRLQQVLQRLGADVICLQEVEVARAQEFMTFMEALGYECVIQDRSKNLFTIANATFYRPAKLELIWTEDRSRALLTAFKLVNMPQSMPVFVANCHLEGHPYKPHERFNQIKSALGRISLKQQSMNSTCDDAHVIVLGDFNSLRQEGVYRYLYRGRLEGGWTERYASDKVLTSTTVSHPYALQDVYANCAAFRLPFTRAVPTNACTIDYIFASRYTPVAGVMQFFSLGKASHMARAALPNSQHPSDHIPLGAVFDVAVRGNKA